MKSFSGNRYEFAPSVATESLHGDQGPEGLLLDYVIPLLDAGDVGRTATTRVAQRLRPPFPPKFCRYLTERSCACNLCTPRGPYYAGNGVPEETEDHRT
jgi:hypothetical protein